MSYKASIASLQTHSDKTCTKCSNPRHRSKSGKCYTSYCTEHYLEDQKNRRIKSKRYASYKVGCGDRSIRKFSTLELANEFIKSEINSGNLIRSLMKTE